MGFDFPNSPAQDEVFSPGEASSPMERLCVADDQHKALLLS